MTKMKINNKSVVTGRVNNFFAYSGWPTVCVDENDTLYAVCSGHRMGHVCPFGKSMMYKSRDKGRVWSVPSIIDDSYSDDRDTGILYLGKGKMLVTNFKHPIGVYEENYEGWVKGAAGQFGMEMLKMCEGLSEEDRKGGSFYKVSTDYGETWGEKTRIPVSCPHGPVLMNDGRLLYVGKEMYSYGAEEPETMSAYVSAPDKIEFTKLSDCPKPKGYDWGKFHEPHCVQFDDGKILALYRAQIDRDGDNFTMFKTFSYDGGKNWSEPEETGICGSPPHLVKLSDGRVLLSYARRMKPFGIYARIIEKDGSFGTEEMPIDGAKDADIGYPATVQMKDGSLETVFYKREISDRYTSIVAVNWSL